MTRITNKRLFEIAKRNVRTDIDEDIKERVLEEYEELFHENQKRKANKKTYKKIKHLFQVSKKIISHNFGDSFHVHHAKETIKEYAKTGIYHPASFKDLEKWINSRLNS